MKLAMELIQLDPVPLPLVFLFINRILSDYVTGFRSSCASIPARLRYHSMRDFKIVLVKLSVLRFAVLVQYFKF